MTTDQALVKFAQAVTDFAVEQTVSYTMAGIEIDGRQFTVKVENGDRLETETKEFHL